MAKFVLAELSDKHDFVLKIKETLENATKQQIVMIIADKMVSKAGVPTKRVNLTFEEGQVIGLVFRKDGDVIQTFLNGKNIPLKYVMDFDKMKDFNAGIEDLALKVKAGQEKFNIKRQNAKVIIPKAKNPSLTAKKRIELAQQQIQENTAKLEKLNQDIEIKTKQLESIKGIVV